MRELIVQFILHLKILNIFKKNGMLLLSQLVATSILVILGAILGGNFMVKEGSFGYSFTEGTM